MARRLTRMRQIRILASLWLVLLAMIPLACGGGGGGGGGLNFTMTTSVAVADLNGDGLADIAATSVFVSGAPPHEGFVTVFLQDPAHPGSFLAASRYGVGSDPFFVGVGDLNTDGLPDLVTANETASSISLLFQRPGTPGGFLPAQNLSTGSHPNTVAIGRLNADAAVDLAVADLGLTLFLQDVSAPGTFPSPTSLGVGSTGSVAIGNLDADGFADLAVVGGGTARVLLQNPHAPGTYLTPVVLATGLQPSFVAIADLNADGRPDLVVTNQASNTVSVFLQDPATPGSFLPPTHYPVAPGPLMVAIGDLDSDGRPDLAVANEGPTPNGVISVLLQDPSNPGHFQAATQYGAGFQPSSVAIGDLNADGRSDLAAAVGDGVAILLQDPSRPGTFGSPRLLGISH